MLTYHRTSLLESQSQTIVNTVNTVGVMGKGLAASLKTEYPEMFRAYKRICDQHLLDVGKLWLWQGPGRWVLNFPTKKNWRHPSKIEYIEAGLNKFVDTYESKGIREIAFPRLGCGNGGLEWDEVRPLMHTYLSPLPIRVYVHDYDVAMPLPEHQEYSPEFVENSFHDFLYDLGRFTESNWGRALGKEQAFRANLLFVDDQYVLRINDKHTQYDIDEFDLSELWTLLNKGPVDQSRAVGTASSCFNALAKVLSGLDYIRLIEISKDGIAKRWAVESERSKFQLETAAA